MVSGYPIGEVLPKHQSHSFGGYPSLSHCISEGILRLVYVFDVSSAALFTVSVYTPSCHFDVAHCCKEAGCGSVLVLDGNMKNSRDVCAAQYAGFVEYSGLPGRVTTGCMESPQQSSKFCSQHMTRISKKMRSSDDPDNRQGGVIEMILAKKTARNNTLYQVCTANSMHLSFSENLQA